MELNDNYANGKGFLPFDQPEFEAIMLDFVEALKTFIKNNYTYTEDDSVPIIFKFVKNDIVIKNTVNHYYNTQIDNDTVTIVGPYFEFDGEHTDAEDDEFENDYCNNSWVADSTDLAGLV